MKASDPRRGLARFRGNSCAARTRGATPRLARSLYLVRTKRRPQAGFEFDAAAVWPALHVYDYHSNRFSLRVFSMRSSAPCEASTELGDAVSPSVSSAKKLPVNHELAPVTIEDPA